MTTALDRIDFVDFQGFCGLRPAREQTNSANYVPTRPKGLSTELPTKRSRAGRMKSGSDSSTTFLDLGTGLGQRPIVC